MATKVPEGATNYGCIKTGDRLWEFSLDDGLTEFP
jgi:hypothetical protein